VAAFLVERLARLEALLLDLADRVADRARQHLARHHQHVQHLADATRAAGHQQLARTQAGLVQRSRQATQAPRLHLAQLGRQLTGLRYTLPEAARRALGAEAARLRQRSRSVRRRFGRHHQRRREALLRQRYQVQRVFEKQLMSYELTVMSLGNAILQRENQQLRQQLTADPAPTHTS